ncbi:MAG: hemerythrin domain-containing protein [Sandaracinaceae bacterium]|nr:hemerythrin domain-containing protein [Sandaracinaceae bacterium]
MRLVDELHAEHVLIDSVAGSFRAWARAYVDGTADSLEARRYLRFFRVWANDFHHAREEALFLEALVRVASLPKERGPIAVILADHARMAGWLAAIEPAIERDGRADVLALVTRYTRELGHHIDAENHVLFPEGVMRLKRHGAYELEGREPTLEEREAEAEGEALVRRFAPIDDPEAFRGEGCMLCPAYGTSCDGLEREWWTESEWEEIHDRLTGM